MLNIKEKFGVEIKFLITADLNIAAVRAPFLIDPEGVLRAMPKNWKPGDRMIVPTPATPGAAMARPGEGYDTVDWYSRPVHYDAGGGRCGPRHSQHAF